MIEISPDGTLSSARIAELLAPTLGWEKSTDVVAAAAARLGFALAALTPVQAFTLLDDLARTPGMVGITARFARSRLDAPRAQPPSSAVLSAPAPSAPTSKPAVEPTSGPTSRASADPLANGPSSVRAPGSAPRPESAWSATSGPRSQSGRSYDDNPPARSGPQAPGPGTTITANEVAGLLSSAMGSEKANEVVLAATRRLGLAPERLDKTQAMALLDHLAIEPGVVGLCARFGKARLILRFAA